MKRADVRDRNIIGIDWQQSGLCARRLVGHQGVFRTVPMLSEGEYVHKRNGRSLEGFFCGKLADYFDYLRSLPVAEDGGREPGRAKTVETSLLLVSVPKSRLERCQALEFAGRLERMAGELVGVVNVILFPRIRVVWEYCRSLYQKASGVGVIQISEEETQFLLHPGQEIEVSFGNRLAVDGESRQYYNRPVRYRENNYLYETDRFLWQDASYASWYQAFGQICRKVFAAQEWEQAHCPLALTGSESCLPCAEKALTDMEAAAGGGLCRANEVPAYLLWWFCHIHGLEWDDGSKAGWTGRPGESGQFGEYRQFTEIKGNIWDI